MASTATVRRMASCADGCGAAVSEAGLLCPGCLAGWQRMSEEFDGREAAATAERAEVLRALLAAHAERSRSLTEQAKRGLMTAFCGMCACAGAVGGYVASRKRRLLLWQLDLLGKQDWRRLDALATGAGAVFLTLAAVYVVRLAVLALTRDTGVAR